MLGLGGADDRGDRKPTVTVEHDPDASDEAAVKGVDADATADDAHGSPATAGADAGTADPSDADAAGSTGSEPSAVEEGEAVEEAPDDVEATDDTEVTDEAGTVEETETADDTGASDDAGAAGDADPSGAGGEPVETVKGVGPAYADRLGTAGVETLDDLAAADAADLAERTSLSEKRLSRWIERARDRLE